MMVMSLSLSRIVWIAFLLLLLCAAGITDVRGFSVVARLQSKSVTTTTTTRLHHQSSTTTSTTQQSVVVAGDTETTATGDDDSSGDEGIKLVYPCQCSFTSEPLPVGTTRQELWNFFSQPTTRRLVFSGGGTLESKDVYDDDEIIISPDDDNIHEMWMQACDYFDLPPHLRPPSPSMNDDNDNDNDNDNDRSSSPYSVLAVTLALDFPGSLLSIQTTSLNGIQLVTSSQDDDDGIDDTALPQFHCVLLAEKQHVTGAAPLVWLYKRITAGLAGQKQQKQQQQQQQQPQEYSPSAVKAQSQFRIVQTTINPASDQDDDDNNDQQQQRLLFAFCLECNLNVITHVPKHLVRLLPVSKETIENMGTAAVARVIPKGAQSSVIAARRAFLDDYYKQEEEELVVDVNNFATTNNNAEKATTRTAAATAAPSIVVVQQA